MPHDAPDFPAFTPLFRSRTMLRIQWTRTPLLAALAIAVGLSACSDNGTAPSTGTLSASQAQDVADVVTTDADAMLDASTLTSTGVMLAPGLSSGNPPCSPVITPLPPVNSDGDLVP